MSTEALIFCASLLFSLAYNASFWHAALALTGIQWRLAGSLLVVVTAVHMLLLGLMVGDRSAKAVLTLLFLVTALASHYMSAYGVYIDADMVRNVLHTDRRESMEMLSVDLLLPTALAALPVALAWRVRLRRRSFRGAIGARALFMLLAIMVGAIGAITSFRPLSSLIRNHREVRYLVTPANYLVGLASVMFESSPGPRPALTAVGTDAHQRQRPAGTRPRLLVLVVGETARAQNWGLNGYQRQTTPELARIPGLLNFPFVTACGSSTEVSLPCMFSRTGRANYAEERIRSEESVLHVLDHAGVRTLWRDNQSGCKGACDGLELERLQDSLDPSLCAGSRCFDEILLKDLATKVRRKPGDMVVVLHQVGNHGPRYFERYPERFRSFLPACESVELANCERHQIVNAYDNALLYTDHFLARTIALLQALPDLDTVMLYVSDHGESLGEKGLYLHGVPYPIAPDEQLRVPMVAWLSPRFAAANRLDLGCLAQRASQPASHDQLFSTVLGLLDVSTREYRAQDDMFSRCRG